MEKQDLGFCWECGFIFIDEFDISYRNNDNALYCHDCGRGAKEQDEAFTTDGIIKEE